RRSLARTCSSLRMSKFPHPTGLPAGEECEPAEELSQDQVEESECHGRRSSRASSSDAKPHVNIMDEVSGTHRPGEWPSSARRGRWRVGAGGHQLALGGMGRMLELARSNVRNIPHPSLP